MLRSVDVGCGAYGAGWIARWTLVDGFPRCVEAPLSIADTDPADLAVQVAVNRAVAGLLEKVEAVEAAQRLLAAGEPPEQWVAQPEGGLAESPAWIAWQAALAAVAAASPSTMTLARTRAGTLAEDEAGFILALPPVPPIDDPCTATADCDGLNWAVRPLSAAELPDWPLRRRAAMAKLPFAQLLSSVLGEAKAQALLSTFSATLSLAADVDFDDVFTAVLDGPSYADQLAAAGTVTAADVMALRLRWPLG
jgi:hypothetical protein